MLACWFQRGFNFSLSDTYHLRASFLFLFTWPEASFLVGCSVRLSCKRRQPQQWKHRKELCHAIGYGSVYNGEGADDYCNDCNVVAGAHGHDPQDLIQHGVTIPSEAEGGTVEIWQSHQYDKGDQSASMVITTMFPWQGACMRILPCPLAAQSCLLLVFCSKNGSHKFVFVSTLPEQSGLSQPSRGSLLGQVAALCRPTRKALVMNSLERGSGQQDDIMGWTSPARVSSWQATSQRVLVDASADARPVSYSARRDLRTFCLRSWG